MPAHIAAQKAQANSTMPTEAGESRAVQDLLRLLVSKAAAANGNCAQAHPESDLEEIVIDADVDGVRYLVVRVPRSGHPSTRLSPRELEIVRMVALGHPNKVIAGVLNISSWTVCTHLRRIFAKLGVGSRAAMVARLSEFRSIGRDANSSQKSTASTKRA